MKTLQPTDTAQYAQRIVERLESLDVRKIILFGSYIWGELHPDSDLDVMVVLAGEEVPHSSAEKGALYRRVRDRCARCSGSCLWICWCTLKVCTANLWSAAACSRAKWRKKGRSSMRKAAEEWVVAARDDLETVREILDNPRLTHIAAFHARQGVEKCFKAVLEQHEQDVPTFTTW